MPTPRGRSTGSYLAGNTFVNTMTQKPTLHQLLPLQAEDAQQYKHRWDYMYEPDAKELLDGLLTRFIESQVYQAVVENFACEQAARMVAMKSASENAGRAHQRAAAGLQQGASGGITQELAEIVGGAAAGMRRMNYGLRFD
jgi:F-type H+-transporting ATPase subunit gamma